MKTKVISIVCLLSGAYAAVAQNEYDDMYFTRKDRAVQQVATIQKTEKPQKSLNALTETNSAYQAVSRNISMVGYTGRTINPDYQPGASSVVAASYFTPNYQPTRVNNALNSSNSNFTGFNNFYGPGSFYGSRFGYGSMYSPFGYGANGGYGYSPYSYGYDPYYSGYSGWGSSPYMYGNPYGYGNGFSMYSGFYSGMYGNGFGNGFGYGCPGYGSGYYGGNVVVVNSPDSHVNTVYGKRQSRSSENSVASNYSRGGVTNSSVDPNQGTRGGRVASTSSSNAYYQRGWRQDPTINQTTTTSNGSRSGFSTQSSGSRSGWSSFSDTPSRNSGFSNSGFSNSSFGTSRSSNTNSGSFSTGGSTGGGSRSTGGSSGGGSTGGRGRN